MEAGKIFDRLKRLLRPGPDAPGKLLFHDENGRLQLAVRPEDLICIEAAGNYAVVRYASGGGRPARHPVRCPLHVLEARFAGTALVRCRRGCIVNMDKILSARREEDGYVLELETGPVSVTRTYEKRVIAALESKDS